MALAFWSRRLNRTELDVPVPDAAHAIYDRVYAGTGNGSTSVCSASRDLKIVVKRGKLLTEVPARVSKTGDDFVVAISAEVAKPASPNK